jgi:hypothetical protein
MIWRFILFWLLNPNAKSIQRLVRRVLLIGLILSRCHADAATLSASCRECHPSEYEQWAASHHGLAERALSPQRDRSAFEPTRTFKAGTQTNETRFRDGQCQIVTLGFRTNTEAYAAERVIGVEPVRQFLTATTAKISLAIARTIPRQ